MDDPGGGPAGLTEEATAATAWLVVPCLEKTAILAKAGPPARLPSVAFAAHRVPTDTSIADVLRASLGIDTRLVRQLDIVGDVGPDVVVLLEAVPAAAAPPGTRWLRRHEVAEVGWHAAAVERWFAEAEGTPPPRRRMPWYQLGWFEETTRWVDEMLAPLGHRRMGSLQPVTHTPYSAVSRLASSMGELFLKASRSGEEHTARLAGLLSERVPGRVTGTVAIERTRGWWLSPAVGVRTAATDRALVDEALAVLAEVQMASAGWMAELTALGCPDLGLGPLARDAESVITDDSVMVALEPEERSALAHAAARVPSLCEAAEAFGLPVCLQHGDFGPHNVLCTADGPVLVDWRGWIGHPFADAHLLLQNVDDPTRRRFAWDAYLRPWAAGFPRDRLDEAVSAMLPVFNAEYLVQVGREVVGVAREPAAYEPWTGRQLGHSVRWFARRLVHAAARGPDRRPTPPWPAPPLRRT